VTTGAGPVTTFDDHGGERPQGTSDDGPGHDLTDDHGGDSTDDSGHRDDDSGHHDDDSGHGSDDSGHGSDDDD
jgi:zinc/manganese transport system substrate-binding protein